MTSLIKRGVTETYQDHLTYPILIIENGICIKIKEMLGKDVNAWKERHKKEGQNDNQPRSLVYR